MYSRHFKRRFLNWGKILVRRFTVYIFLLLVLTLDNAFAIVNLRAPCISIYLSDSAYLNVTTVSFMRAKTREEESERVKRRSCRLLAWNNGSLRSQLHFRSRRTRQSITEQDKEENWHLMNKTSSNKVRRKLKNVARNESCTVNSQCKFYPKIG